MVSQLLKRRLPVGAEVQPGGGVHFRVWAPRAARVEVLLPRGLCVALEPEGNGYFSGLAAEAASGDRYRFRMDGKGQGWPDPVSRFQPEGVHGPSEVVDPSGYVWQDGQWPGVRLPGQVIYELHVGTFTREGTFQAARRQLAELAAAGMTLLELMPLAEFFGQRGWGYDGVYPFAPTRLYGRPDDLRQFVDEAHAHGLGVLLDVVYNHVGPEGNYLKEYSPGYFSQRYRGEWGEPFNLDGPDSGPVREFVLSNVHYWIDEFHFDGLRLDATQGIFDASAVHILDEIGRVARRAAGDRAVVVIAENEPQDTRLLRQPRDGGYGLDGLWNDDFHHTAFVRLTGRIQAYFTDYRGSPQEFVSVAKRGFLFQGQWYRWQGKGRGTSTRGLEPWRLVQFLENHDQVANSRAGQRRHQQTSPGKHRAMTALWLLTPGTPLFFQGQEFNASAPFLFFSDHRANLARSVAQGRKDFLAQFASWSTPETQAALPDPGDPATFERCKLDFNERQTHAAAYALHRDLLRLRREDPVFGRQEGGELDGAVLGDAALVLRWFNARHGDRLLVVNFGAERVVEVVPEPLLAPPARCRWHVLWTSEDLRYGGEGLASLRSQEGGWRLPAEAAVVLAPTTDPMPGGVSI